MTVPEPHWHLLPAVNGFVAPLARQHTGWYSSVQILGSVGPVLVAHLPTASMVPLFCLVQTQLFDAVIGAVFPGTLQHTGLYSFVHATGRTGTTETAEAQRPVLSTVPFLWLVHSHLLDAVSGVDLPGTLQQTGAKIAGHATPPPGTGAVEGHSPCEIIVPPRRFVQTHLLGAVSAALPGTLQQTGMRSRVQPGLGAGLTGAGRGVEHTLPARQPHWHAFEAWKVPLQTKNQPLRRRILQHTGANCAMHEQAGFGAGIGRHRDTTPLQDEQYSPAPQLRGQASTAATRRFVATRRKKKMVNRAI